MANTGDNSWNGAAERRQSLVAAIAVCGFLAPGCGGTTAAPDGQADASIGPREAGPNPDAAQPSDVSTNVEVSPCSIGAASDCSSPVGSSDSEETDGSSDGPVALDSEADVDVGGDAIALPACAFAPSLDSSDASGAYCFAARTLIACRDDAGDQQSGPTNTPFSLGPKWTCQVQCAPTEYGVGCGLWSQTRPPPSCRQWVSTFGTPSAPFYCCPCGAGSVADGGEDGAVTDGGPTTDGGGDSGTCTTDTDCGSGYLCGFPESAGCSAPGTCFPASGARCNAIVLACACDGTSINIACNGLPSGYAPKSFAHSGACGLDSGSRD